MDPHSATISPSVEGVSNPTSANVLTESFQRWLIGSHSTGCTVQAAKANQLRVFESATKAAVSCLANIAATLFKATMSALPEVLLIALV